LIIPNVLNDVACDILIEAWKRPTPVWGREALESDVLKNEKSDYKIETDTDAGKLVQHHILDPEINRIVDTAFIRRIIPEIYKAYRYKVSQHEQYKILRYSAADGGFLGPHRDNPTPGTAHRHFTMTTNLVASGFDGGELRFPEYGGHLYRADKGSAVVWSASLLHEVTQLTAGERFVLGTHLF
jgi:predicted 2-oxoglutarate/Fe(II)-dependent dioxygenase YbiX